jgi:hypothetical protein
MRSVVITTPLSYETHQTIRTAEEWTDTAADAMAVVGVWPLWEFAIATLAFAEIPLVALLPNEKRRSIGGNDNLAASSRPCPVSSTRGSRERKKQEAPLAPHVHL